MSYYSQNRRKSYLSQNRRLQKELEQMKADMERRKRMEQAGKTEFDEESGLQRVQGGESHFGLVRPDYYTKRGEDGQLADQFKTTLGDSFSTLKDKAMTDGDSIWAQSAREQQEQVRSGQMDQANRQATGNLTNAQTQIAMRGGLAGGASERMAMQTNRDLMDRQQGVQSDFNKSNLDITMQDETTKNQLLGKVGQAEQMIDQDNVQALRGDYDQQNQLMKDFYSADASAYGAEKTAEAQKAAGRSCFVGGQKVQLVDGTFIDIEDVMLGDVLMVGGEVYKLVIGTSDHYYDYEGVKVTGSHCVLENGKWIRVGESKRGKRVDGKVTVYSPANDEHRMMINGVMFTDYDEVDNTDDYNEEMIMEQLNANVDV